jgi:DNA-binding NtrC family response regulator
MRFAILDSLRSEQLRPLLRAYLARFPTPDDYVEENCTVSFGKPQARAARRDAFSVFLSQGALSRLTAHPWPGNHRELKLLATNALVFSLVQQLDAPSKSRSERAPAVLAISDQLIDQLLGKPRAPGPVLSGKGASGDRRVEISLKPAQSFAEISADVERQYLMALFHAHGGDLDRMAVELFGPGATRRKVHLRMNQLGLRLRNLRGTTA